MAISFIEALSGSANNGGNVTLTFTAAQSGDFVLVVGGHQEQGSNAGVSTAGYTEEADTVTPNRFSISRKFITSDTNVTCLGDGQGSDGTAYVALVFRGVDTSTPLDASITSGTGTGEPNSPSITTVTNGAVVVSAFLLNDGRGLNSGPSGYSNATIANASEVNNVTAGIAWIAQATAGAENPSQWDLAGVSTEDLRASTIALRPAVTGINVDGAASFGSIRGTATFRSPPNTTSPFVITGTITPTFKGQGLFPTVTSMTGTNATGFVGDGVTTNPVPFSMTGTGTASFVGSLQGAGGLSATGTATATFKGAWPVDALAEMGGNVTTTFVGAVDRLKHVREVIESRGTATVSMRV